MAATADLLPDFLMYAPACPEPLALRALSQSANRFARETQAIIQHPAPFIIKAGTTEIDLNELVDGEVVVTEVRQFMIDGFPVYQSHGRPSRFALGSSLRWSYRTDEQTMQLHPSPDKDVSASMELVVAPTITAATLPDIMTSRYRDGVVFGAVARVCRTPGQSYTSMDQAALASQNYITERSNARVDAMNRLGAPMSVQMRPFA